MAFTPVDGLPGAAISMPFGCVVLAVSKHPPGPAGGPPSLTWDVALAYLPAGADLSHFRALLLAGSPVARRRSSVVVVRIGLGEIAAIAAFVANGGYGIWREIADRSIPSLMGDGIGRYG